MEQRVIDWTRARQLMVLASAEVTDVEIVEGKTPRKVRGIVLKAVLQAIDHHGRGRAAWVSYETIAREARVSLRQAKRAIVALEQTSLLVVDTRKCNHYSIVWNELNLRCPLHRQFDAYESAAPDPHPVPDRDDSSNERSALRPQRSALETRRSALRPQRSALEGTQTDPEPIQNRNEPPPPTPSQPDGGGWREICEEWKYRIGQVTTLAAEAKASGESPDAFLARLRSAWEIACHPLNRPSLKKPAGAVVHWMRLGTWPVDGLVDPQDKVAVQERSVAASRRDQEVERSWQQSQMTKLVQQGRKAKASDEEIKAALLKRWPSAEVAAFGW